MAYNTLAKKRAWQVANREKTNAQAKLRYAANPERFRLVAREGKARERLLHPERQLARNAKYRPSHKADTNARARARYAEDPEKLIARSARRRALKAQASINDFTAAQWREMQAAYDHRCVYCGKRAKGKLTQDHLTPLSKGGNHTLSNILPACFSCNSRKRDGAVLVPVQPLLL